MKISKISISNFRSFGPDTVEIMFSSSKTALIGKNNSGKTNILTALDIVLGNKDPRYHKMIEKDYFDSSKPLQVEVQMTFSGDSEIYTLAIPKKHKDILYSKFKKDPLTAFVSLIYKDSLKAESEEETEEKAENEVEPTKKESKFTILAGGIAIHTKIPDVRKSICRFVAVPAVRDIKDQLSGLRWTLYGQLMKDVLEESSKYPELSTALISINNLIEEILEGEKKTILEHAKLITFIEGLRFQLTKDNKPSELLRNLELYVKDRSKYIHIDETGTGTQSALIISILEVALRHKSTQSRVFFIEEPEFFLAPQGIRYLSSLFDDFISDKMSQVIVTTHSSTLISMFDPIEIIRLSKPQGFTQVNQLPSDFVDEEKKVTRSMNCETAEMFFADKVFLVEGETEKIIFPRLSKNVNLNNGESANFLKNNISVTNVNGKESLINYIKILDKFKIQWLALADDDLLTSPSSITKICSYLGLDSTKPKEELRKAFAKKGFGILSVGETEDLIPDTDLVKMTSKNLPHISKAKSNYGKTSKAFEEDIFDKSKPEYAFDITEFYVQQGSSPFDEIIKWVTATA